MPNMPVTLRALPQNNAPEISNVHRMCEESRREKESGSDEKHNCNTE